MSKRARFTRSELDRLFSAAKSNGVNIRIVPTQDSLTIETIEAKPAETKAPRGLRVVEGKDIIL